MFVQSPILNYEKELHLYAEIIEVFAIAKKQLIQQGIHPFSQQDWLNLSNNFADSSLVQKAQQGVRLSSTYFRLDLPQ